MKKRYIETKQPQLQNARVDLSTAALISLESMLCYQQPSHWSHWSLVSHRPGPSFFFIFVVTSFSQLFHFFNSHLPTNQNAAKEKSPLVKI